MRNFALGLRKDLECAQGGTLARVEQRLCGRLRPQTQVAQAPGVRASGIRAVKSEDVGHLKSGRSTICRERRSVSPRMRQNQCLARMLRNRLTARAKLWQPSPPAAKTRVRKENRPCSLTRERPSAASQPSRSAFAGRYSSATRRPSRTSVLTSSKSMSGRPAPLRRRRSRRALRTGPRSVPSCRSFPRVCPIRAASRS
jgi:hypothetical protein